MLPSAKRKRLPTVSASNGSAASSTKRRWPLVKLRSKEERSKLRLEMSKSAKRRRDSARLVKQKKLVKLKRLPNASLKKKLKAQMMVARPTRTRMPWVMTTLTTKRPCWTRLRI